MGNLKNYFESRSIDSLKKDYGDSFGEVLIKLYQTLIHFYEVERATNLSASLSDGLKLHRNDEILRDSNLMFQNSEIKSEVLHTATQQLIIGYINAIPLILRNDEVMRKHMRLVKATDQYVEIEFIHSQD